MDFELAEEQQMVRETTRAFVEREVKPVASRLDREAIYPS
jgi:alkylation response protein AidB-like acyl-CoA dehydrogenase